MEQLSWGFKYERKMFGEGYFDILRNIPLNGGVYQGFFFFQGDSLGLMVVFVFGSHKGW